MGTDACLFDIGNNRRALLQGRWYHYSNVFSAPSDDEYEGVALLMTDDQVISRSYRMEDKECAKALRDEVALAGSGPFIIAPDYSSLYDILESKSDTPRTSHGALLTDLFRYIRDANLDIMQSWEKTELYTICGALNSLVQKIQSPEKDESISMADLEAKYDQEKIGVKS